MRHLIAQALLLAGLAFVPTSALAQVKLEGTFTAQKICPANKRLTSDNPGEISTAIGQTYRLVGKNKDNASHYLIVVPEAPQTERRWVDVACGAVEITSEPSNDTGDNAGKDHVIEIDSIENVLAASWQPTFCATDRGKSKTECKTQTSDRPDAAQFSIHGLWPDDLDDTRIFPCYCDNGPPISCRRKLPRVPNLSMSPAIKEKLDVLMPGTQSGLHLHEWTKHGTCYEDYISGSGKGSDVDEYFSDTMTVIEQLNASDVGTLFAQRLGQEITFAELQQAFDAAFGVGAGDRVIMNCSRIDGQNAISELWIGLGGEIDQNSDLATLILAAPTTKNSTTRKSCQKGVVWKVN